MIDEPKLCVANVNQHSSPATFYVSTWEAQSARFHGDERLDLKVEVKKLFVQGTPHYHHSFDLILVIARLSDHPSLYSRG